MSQSAPETGPVISVEEIQRNWHELTLRVAQLEADGKRLEQENRATRALVERAIEYRQKSHAELVNLLTTLVSKLPINDVGVVVSRLIEHNSHVTEVSSNLTKGKLEDNMLQPAVLKALDKSKRELVVALKSTVEELLKLEPPFEAGMLESLVAKPENFYSPAVVRANRGFIKGQIPRERIVKEFGEAALVFFKDVTTDVKFNPRPKAEEIMLVFTDDFAVRLQQHPEIPTKRAELQALHQKIRQSREATEPARAQKNAFLRLSFILEVIHYYENQSTESPDVVFAQRLPPLIEQLAAPADREALDEKLIQPAETLLAFIVSPDHRNAVINNVGKAGNGLARTLRFTLAFRAEKFSELDRVTIECVKHLLPAGQAPLPAAVAAVLRLMNPPMQMTLVRAIIATDRLQNKEAAQALGKAVAKELGLQESQLRFNDSAALSPEQQQRLAWENIKNLIAARATPAEIVAAIRKRLHGQYDVDEVKLCWLALTEGDPMVFVRVFSLLPYQADGKTDTLARAMMETFVTRLTHEKYAAVYTKITQALRNMFKVKPDSPALVNFLTLVKWVDAEAAAKISRDLGVTAR